MAKAAQDDSISAGAREEISYHIDWYRSGDSWRGQGPRIAIPPELQCWPSPRSHSVIGGDDGALRRRRRDHRGLRGAGAPEGAGNRRSSMARIIRIA
jgi:hypothetical protein